MKRQLTDEEKEKTKKGITKLEDDLAEAKLGKLYAERKMEFLKTQWEFEDFERPLFRENTMKNHTKKIEESNKTMEILNHTLKELRNQLKEGVEVKNKPIGVE